MIISSIRERDIYLLETDMQTSYGVIFYKSEPLIDTDYTDALISIFKQALDGVSFTESNTTNSIIFHCEKSNTICKHDNVVYIHYYDYSDAQSNIDNFPLNALKSEINDLFQTASAKLGYKITGNRYQETVAIFRWSALINNQLITEILFIEKN